MNAVNNIIKSKLSHADRLEIKRLGRPLPLLKIEEVSKTKSREHRRKFNMDIYEKYDWICGCNVRDKMFCFVCLVMGGEQSAWTVSGVSDLKHLTSRAPQHARSSKHMSCFIEFKMLGKTDVGQQLSMAYHTNISQHNKRVDKNRHVLKRIIDCIRFCGAFELALRGHDEKCDSENPGIFLGLINFTSEIDIILQTHLNDATVFKGTSKTIQNELLDFMLQVCREEILSQIKEASYVAIEADETTDFSNIQQLVIIIRYVFRNKIYERFWGFKNPDGHSSENIAQSLLEELEIMGISFDKLIAQSYDGAAVMSGRLNSVQTKVRNKYPNAHFIHCYAHQFNLIIQKAVSSNTGVKLFFANLQAFSTFFSHSAKRTAVLDKIVQARPPRAAVTRWSFQSRTVNCIYENKDKILECLETIIINASDSKTTNEASGLINFLNNDNFQFWLEVFHLIMPHVEIFFNEVQTRGATVTYIYKCQESFEHEMHKVREKIDNVTTTGVLLRPSRNVTVPGDRRSVAAKEVCDTIISQVKDRFQFTGHLSAVRLFLVESFKEYRKNFPDKTFSETVNSYPHFDKNKLKTELQVLYERDDICSVDKGNSICALMKFIFDHDLTNVFSETYKLLLIIATTPMTTAECERCFSTLKRIKTFLRNSMGEERLNALTMLSVEKNLVKNISNFNDKIVNLFSQAKNRRADFLYK